MTEYFGQEYHIKDENKAEFAVQSHRLLKRRVFCQVTKRQNTHTPLPYYAHF